MIRFGYLTITRETTGEAVTGPSVYSMAPDTIEVLDCQHTVRHEYDEQHGVMSGDRKHEPFLIVKEVDVTTPILCDMCTKAELCTEVKLEYYIQVGNSPEPVNFFTWKLTNAYIAHVRLIPCMELPVEYSDQFDLLEEVAFTYQQIQWEHHAHRAPQGLKDLDQQISADAWSSIAS